MQNKSTLALLPLTVLLLVGCGHSNQPVMMAPPTTPVTISQQPGIHLGIVLMMGVYIPPALAEWYRLAARLIGG